MDTIIKFRVTSAEKKRLETEASAVGLSLSAWVRLRLMNSAATLKAIDPEVLKVMAVADKTATRMKSAPPLRKKK